MGGLLVGQSIQGAAVLVCFAKLFGGSVGVQNTGSTTLPALQWQVTGANARLAAGMLGEGGLEKQAQLLQFACGRKSQGQ